MQELHAMNQIEPTGMVRLEWYLARLTRAVLSAFGGNLDNWQDLLIRVEEEAAQSPEDALRNFDMIAEGVRQHGNHQ